MKVKVKCECGIVHIIKIPFRLRNKVDTIDLVCFNCNFKKNFTYLNLKKFDLQVENYFFGINIK